MDSVDANSFSKVTEDFKVIQLVADNVYEILKCVSCSDYCHPPFKQNTEGKLVCPFCFKCGRRGIMVLPGRIFVLEMMYPLFEFPCQYNLEGCSFKGKGTTLVEHHKICNYVSVICPDNSCCWKGRTKQLFDHFSINHADLIEIHNWNSKEISFTTQSEFAEIEFNIILAHGKVFEVHVARNHRTGIFRCIVTNMEPFNTAYYKCMIKFNLGKGRTTTTILDVTQSDNTITRERMYELPQYDLPFDWIDRNYSIIIIK